MSSADDIEVKVSAHGRWVRVFAEADGRDVSHLSYAPQPVRVGPAGEISMAGIAGVGTEPDYRQLGLARRVYQRAMEEIRAGGYGSVGLFTGTAIVAHRLYRRFGFVDTLLPQVGMKLLDAPAYVTKKLAELAREEALAEWQCTLEVNLPPHPPVLVRINCGEVAHLTAAAPVDLALTMSSDAFRRLTWGGLDLDFAEASGQVRWRGAAEQWQVLRRTLAARRSVIVEG